MSDDVEVLLRCARLSLSEEEIERMKKVYAGYHGQLEELMTLDLEGEEVGTSFMPAKPS